MTRALFLGAALSLFACSSAPAQQPEAGAPAARIGDRTVTTTELDERWRAMDAAGQAETMQKLYDGRRGALDAMVAEMLIGEKAKEQGLSADAYVESEISKRVKPVTDAEVVSFYQANINQMNGRPLDQMAPLINRFLAEQRETEARQALVAELRRSGPEVRVLFDAPRRDIALASTDPSLGDPSAPVTIVEFSDFQCPFCRQVAPTLKQVRDKYGDKVRIVWKDFPLTQIHPEAFKAAEAAHCAGDQGRFWEYHDRLFANQEALEPDSLKSYASNLGLDVAAFTTCLDSSKHGPRVGEGVSQGTRLGVNSTPTVYVNGRMLSGAQPLETFSALIEEELSR